MTKVLGRRSLGKISAAGVSRVGRTWLPSLRVGGVSPASRPGGFYIVLVAVALLFCHGAFGYAHQLSPVDAQTAHVAHAAGDQQPDGDQGTDGSHLGGAYFATLLALLFGALLLPGGKGSAAGQLPAPRSAKGGHKVGWLPPPRGPTLTSLQVFRL
ncbi:hypothetical protein BH24ACT18_BH24ACT18_03410 [soil metagenome]